MCTRRPELPAEWRFVRTSAFLADPYRRELAHMVHLRRKAEIQILCGSDPHDDELERALLGTQVESVDPTNRMIEYIVERVRG